MATQNENVFYQKLELSVEKNEFIKLIISNKRDKSSDLKKIYISPIKIKKGFRLSFVFNYATKDITKNFEPEEALIHIKNNLAQDFFNAELFTSNEIIRLLYNKNNKCKIRISEQTFKPLANLQHDRQKVIRLNTKDNIWLQELGIVHANGMIKKDMHDKFRQINKYLEIIEQNIIKKISEQNLKIFDAGSGKGYLTFALYDYLTRKIDAEVQITGIELRDELVNICNEIAQKAQFEHLNFVQGSIIDSNVSKADILIALHACDTATDEAIYQGIKADAKYIAVAPCCQKQVRKDMELPDEMYPILKHGILKERQAVILTDGLRALLLEAKGYKTKVFEFISTEHTPKNIMIIAEKRNNKVDSETIFKSIDKIKKRFGIRKLYLETLLYDENCLNKK